VWSDEEPKRSYARILGMKIVLFGSKYNKIDNLFHPLYDQGNKIIGTQWLAGSFNLSLENFKNEDFQFQNEIAKSGYKKYFNKQ
jgi:hypothetical protein